MPDEEFKDINAQEGEESEEHQISRAPLPKGE
jgi:hypothetical protein